MSEPEITNPLSVQSSATDEILVPTGADGMPAVDFANTKLVGKLAKILGAIGWIPKRGHNSFHNYDYTREADLVDVIRRMLSDAGIFVFTSVTSIGRRPGNQDSRGNIPVITEVRTLHTFFDSESGETFAVECIGEGEDKSDKGVYKAMTGAMKYFLMKNFLVSTGDDPETDTRQKSQQQGNVEPEEAAARSEAEYNGALADVYRALKKSAGGGEHAKNRELLASILSLATAGKHASVQAMPPAAVIALRDALRSGLLEFRIPPTTTSAPPPAA